MDSLKILLAKGEYNSIIEKTKDSTQPEILFIRIASFIANGNSKEALNIIEKNNESLYEYSPYLTIKNHLGLLEAMGNYLSYKKVYEDYANKSYVSQEVEEVLRNANKTIEDVLENKEKIEVKITNSQLLQNLKETYDPIKFQSYINAIDKKNMYFFIPFFKEYLVSTKSKKRLRLQLLFKLMKEQVDEEVNFLSNGKVEKINLKNDKPPFMSEDFETLEKMIEIVSKNTTINSISNSLLRDYFLSIYPRDKVENKNAFLLAIFSLTKDFIKDESPLELNNKLVADEKLISQYKKNIIKIIEDLEK